jgi:hypothetical protein
VVGRQFVAKVERKEEIKYDKDGLTRALEAMGQEKFRELFDWEYVARARKPEIDAFIKHSPHGQLIEAARRVREAAPSVSFTANEGD